jgi:hypothetical protein
MLFPKDRRSLDKRIGGQYNYQEFQMSGNWPPWRKSDQPLEAIGHWKRENGMMPWRKDVVDE